MEDHGQRVTFDDMVDALADVQRRKLLIALGEHNPQDDSPTVIDPDGETDALERALAMDHVHLPKLANYGFIEWDRVENEVTKGPNYEEIRPLLELLDDHRNELPADWL